MNLDSIVYHFVYDFLGAVPEIIYDLYLCPHKVLLNMLFHVLRHFCL